MGYAVMGLFCGFFLYYATLDTMCSVMSLFKAHLASFRGTRRLLLMRASLTTDTMFANN